jgi:NAD(P)H-dependent flavin oxidoreductase YrpB (nitropropane dioxygenase family)
MHTPICDELGIEFPIFAFTHCRDVVVAVSKAGGFGVLGAVGFTPEQLEIELKWIDENIGDHPYGVDIVIPNKYEGMDSHLSAEELAETLRKMVPQEHLDFGKKILADHGVPIEDSDGDSLQLLGWTEATATPQVEVALQHPKVKMIANALGTPPAEMIKHIHDAGLKVAALCGSPSQARKHADAGVDIIIAQGGEAGGHCGEVGSVVLWPQVVKEVAPVPVLGAGGIGSGQQIAAALALGCQGAWTGSQWLMVEESSNTPVQQAAYVKAGSRDTVRSRSFTGKPARMLRTTGPRPGRRRTTRSRSECRCSTWFPAWRCGRPTDSPTNPSTWRSTRSVRSSGSSPRWRRRRPSSNVGCRSTWKRLTGSTS